MSARSDLPHFRAAVEAVRRGTATCGCCPTLDDYSLRHIVALALTAIPSAPVPADPGPLVPAGTGNNDTEESA